MRRRVRTTFSDLSATDLMVLMRAGDREALGELYRRYHRYAFAVARQSGAPEPDDAVAESFRLIASAVSTGNGPTVAFGPYLATTVRSVAQRQRVSAARVVQVDHSALEGAAVADLDTDPALAAAFASLPERWQHVIWYTFTGVPVGQACVVSVDLSSLPAALRTATFELDGTLDGSTTVTVSAAAGTVTGVDFGYASPASSIPRTGSETQRALRIATMALLSGVGLLLIAAVRRRRHA